MLPSKGNSMLLPSISGMITHAQRYSAIDNTLSKQMPKELTRIVDQYDGEGELMDFVTDYDLAELLKLALCEDRYFASGGHGMESLDKKHRVVNMEAQLHKEGFSRLDIFGDGRRFSKVDADALNKLRKVWHSPDSLPAVIAVTFRMMYLDQPWYPLWWGLRHESSLLAELRILMDSRLVLRNLSISDWTANGCRELFVDASLTNMTFTNCTFSSVNFSGADLYGSTFIDVTFNHGFIPSTALLGVKLIRVKFFFMTLGEDNGSTGEGIEFIDVTFKSCKFGVSFFRDTSLIRAAFINIDRRVIMEIDFYNTLLLDVKFSSVKDSCHSLDSFWQDLRPIDRRMRKLLLEDDRNRRRDPSLPMEFYYTSSAPSSAPPSAPSSAPSSAPPSAPPSGSDDDPDDNRCMIL